MRAVRELPCAGCLHLTRHVPAPAEHYGPGAWTCSGGGRTDVFAAPVGSTNSTRRPGVATSPPPRPEARGTATVDEAAAARYAGLTHLELLAETPKPTAQLVAGL